MKEDDFLGPSPFSPLPSNPQSQDNNFMEYLQNCQSSGMIDMWYSTLHGVRRSQYLEQQRQERQEEMQPIYDRNDHAGQIQIDLVDELQNYPQVNGSGPQHEPEQQRQQVHEILPEMQFPSFSEELGSGYNEEQQRQHHQVHRNQMLGQESHRGQRTINQMIGQEPHRNGRPGNRSLQPRNRGGSRGGRDRSNSNQSTHSEPDQQREITNIKTNCATRFCTCLILLIRKRYHELLLTETDNSRKNLKRQIIDELIKTHEHGSARKSFSLKDFHFIFSSEIKCHLTHKIVGRFSQFIRKICREYGPNEVEAVCQSINNEIKTCFVQAAERGKQYFKTEFIDVIFKEERFFKQKHYVYFSSGYAYEVAKNPLFQSKGDIRQKARHIYLEQYLEQRNPFRIDEQQKQSSSNQVLIRQNSDRQDRE